MFVCYLFINLLCSYRRFWTGAEQNQNGKNIVFLAYRLFYCFINVVYFSISKSYEKLLSEFFLDFMQEQPIMAKWRKTIENGWRLHELQRMGHQCCTAGLILRRTDCTAKSRPYFDTVHSLFSLLIFLLAI